MLNRGRARTRERNIVHQNSSLPDAPLHLSLSLRSSFTVARYVTASPPIPTTRPKNARATCIVKNGILILSLPLSSPSFIDETSRIVSRILLPDDLSI